MLVLRRDAVPALASPTLQILMLIAGIVGFVGGGLLQTYGPDSAKAVSRVAVYGCSAGLIIVALILAEMNGRLPDAKTLVYLGGASYAIYLVHFSVITLLVAFLVKVQIVPLNKATLIGVALLAVAAGIAFDQWIDQPIQRKLRRGWRDRSARAGLGATRRSAGERSGP